MVYLAAEKRNGLTIRKVADKLAPRLIAACKPEPGEAEQGRLRKWLTEPRRLWAQYTYLLNRTYENRIYMDIRREDPDAVHHMSFETVTGYVYIARLSLLYPDLPGYLNDGLRSIRTQRETEPEQYKHMPPMYYNFWNKTNDIYFLDHLSTVIELLNRWGNYSLNNWYRRDGKRIKDEDTYIETIVDLAYNRIEKFETLHYRNYFDNYYQDITEMQKLYEEAVHWLGYVDASSIPTKGEITRVRDLAVQLQLTASKLNRKAERMEERLRLNKAAKQGHQEFPD